MQNNHSESQTQPDAVSHPSAEQWMDYLYGESTRVDRSRLGAHLKGCQICQETLQGWRGVKSSLSEWKLPAQTPVMVSRPYVKWAAAAAIMALGVALGLAGSVTVRARETASLRNELREEVRSQWEQQRKQLLAETSKIIEEKRAQQNALFSAALRELSSNQDARWVSMQREVENLALLTQSSLAQAQEQIVSLASAADSNQPR